MARSLGCLVAVLLLAMFTRTAEAQASTLAAVDDALHLQASAPAARTGTSAADVGLVIAGSATAGFGAVALIFGLNGFLATYSPMSDAAAAVWLSTGIACLTTGIVLLALGLSSQGAPDFHARNFDGVIRF